MTTTNHTKNLLELKTRLTELETRICARADIDKNTKAGVLDEIWRSLATINYCLVLIGSSESQSPIINH